MKDHKRDYITAAFRFYAVNGKSVDKYKRQLLADMLAKVADDDGIKNGICKPTEEQLERAEKMRDKFKASIDDMQAVENAIKILERSEKGSDIIKCIEAIYYTDADKDIKMGEISERVHKASLNIHIGEATVYRYLRLARDMVALERGLRL